MSFATFNYFFLMGGALTLGFLAAYILVDAIRMAAEMIIWAFYDISKRLSNLKRKVR